MIWTSDIANQFSRSPVYTMATAVPRRYFKRKIGVPLPIPLEVPLLAIVQIRAKNNVDVEAASSRDFKFVTT